MPARTRRGIALAWPKETQVGVERFVRRPGHSGQGTFSLVGAMRGAAWGATLLRLRPLPCPSSPCNFLCPFIEIEVDLWRDWSSRAYPESHEVICPIPSAKIVGRQANATPPRVRAQAALE
jgi:hypothetical protein